MDTVVCAVLGLSIFYLARVPSWVFLTWIVVLALAYRSAKARDETSVRP